MSQDKREQDFDDYLEGDSRLSADYQKASTEQPSAHLDDAILAASRRAVNSTPAKVATPFSSVWQVPLSLAAVLVLAVTVVVTMQYENDEIYLKEPTASPARVIGEARRNNEPAVFVDNELSQTKDRVNLAEEESVFESDDALGSKNEISAGFDLRDENKESLGKTAKKLKQQKLNSAKISTRELALDIQAPVAQEVQSYAPEPAAIAKTREREQNVDVVESPRQFKSSPVRVEESRVGIDTLSSALPEVEKTGRVKAESGLSMKPRLEKKLLSQAAGMSVPTSSPENWLDLIEQMWSDGNRAEAIEELKRFHLKFPDYEEEKIKLLLDSELIETVIVE